MTLQGSVASIAGFRFPPASSYWPSDGTSDLCECRRGVAVRVSRRRRRRPDPRHWL